MRSYITIYGFKELSPENSNHSLPFYLPLSPILVRTLFFIVYGFLRRGVMIEDSGLITAVTANLIPCRFINNKSLIKKSWS